MTRSEEVIKVLEHSNKRTIGYENREWIRENSMDMNIRVYAEDCNVELHHVELNGPQKSITIVQEGKVVDFHSEFDKKKEALLLSKFEDINYIFHYFPKNQT